MSYYAVKIGKRPGIYLSWDKCKEVVNGFPGAIFKKFPTEEEALEFIGVKEKIILTIINQSPLLPPIVPPVVDEKKSETFFFDGSCIKEIAGGACYFPRLKKVFYARLDGKGTSSRGELLGLLLGLKYGPLTDTLHIVGDSTYAMNQASGAHKTKANHDLVKKIHERVSTFKKVTYEHVYSHKGIEANEICDIYAKKATSLSHTDVVEEEVT